MSTWCKIKLHGELGPHKNNDKDISILNRTAKWMADRITYEAVEKHLKRILEQLGLKEDPNGLGFSGKQGR